MEPLWQCIHLICLATVLVAVAPMAEGCSCERLHPQQHFCQASYVIGGKVLKREYVRIDTASDIEPSVVQHQREQLSPDIGGIDPLPEKQPYPGGGLHRLRDEPAPEGSPPHPEDLAPLPHPEDFQPLPQPDGIEPLPHPEGLEPHPEGLQPQPELPPLPLPEELKPSGDHGEDPTTTATTSDPSVEATAEATTSIPAEGQEEEIMPETRPAINPDSMEAWNYKIVYTIKLLHIYLTGIQEESWKLGDEVQLATPASAAHCGQTSLKTGKSYLITSRMSGRVNLCNWVQEHHKLTPRQKQGLKSVYGKNCDHCQIVACPTSRHCKRPKENRGTMCIYDASLVRIGVAYSPYDCLASHSRCTLRHGHKCKWQKNNDYHECTKPQLP